MMKVKPFSYHIPRRRAHTSTCVNKTYSGNLSYSNKNSIATTTSSPHSSFCLWMSIETVLILVLLGFIGVAGQGKLSQMGESSTFSTQSHHLRATSLSHQGFDSLSNLDALEEEEDGDGDDEALQRKISLMGHYGAKQRNHSLAQNYSEHHHRSITSLYDDDQKYKLEGHVDTLLTVSHDSLLSLDDNNNDDQSKTNYSLDPPDENSVVSSRPRSTIKNRKERKLEDDDFDDDASNDVTQEESPVGKVVFPVVTEKVSQDQTSRRGEFLNAKKYARGKSREATSHNQDIDEDYASILFPSSFREDDNDEYDILDRFIPGNSSHLSGKHRFRQISQAEVDGFTNSSSGSSEDENSLLSNTSRRRPRRSVVHLYDMVVCSTGCNPLIFKGYGCYCGFLGSGLTVDGIDKCCAKHDWCYHHAKCPPLLTYFVPYYWRCDHGRPQCVTDFRGWKGICGAHLCECDRQFAECLKQFPCPRSRAMCVTSPFSQQWHADPRTFPFAVSRRPPRIPLLPYPLGRIFN